MGQQKILVRGGELGKICERKQLHCDNSEGTVVGHSNIRPIGRS
jgi:hypothetical protein